MKTIKGLLYDDATNYIRSAVVFSIACPFIQWTVMENKNFPWYEGFAYGLVFLLVIIFCDIFGNMHRDIHTPSTLAHRITSETILPWINHYHKNDPDKVKVKHIAEVYKNMVYIMDESNKDELIKKLDNIIETN